MVQRRTDMVIAWNDEFVIGVPSIDKQHQFLVSLVAQLQEAMLSGEGQQFLPSLFDALVTYTEYHFGWEEQILAQHEYPDLEAHRNLHQELRTQVESLRQRFKAGELKATAPVLAFLRNWLSSHILGPDTKYGPHLRGREAQ